MDQMCARARAAHDAMNATAWARRHRVARHASFRWTARGTRSVHDPRARVLVSSLVRERAVRGDDAREERGTSRARVPLDSTRGLMSEIPIVIGLLYGFDGSGHWINHVLIDRYVLGVSKPGDAYDPSKYSLTRKYAVLWAFLTVFTYALYFTLCPLSYYLSFQRRDKDGKNKAKFTGREGKDQVRNEIYTSVWSIAVMTAMTAPFELMVEAGWTKLYWDVKDYGWLYLCVTPFLFLIFSDTCIYWIHRGLHHRSVYAPIHKLHHKYKDTTPFSAYAFHPLDGWLQGCPYHIFIFLFPMHHLSYFIALGIVGLWTINIHDRVSMKIPYVNCAAHHTIHHTMFNYNYGQYFTFWDKIGGSYRNPHMYPPYAAENPSLKKAE